MGPIPPGQLVDPAGHRSWTRVAGEICSSAGPRIRNRVARESWLKPPAFRPGPKSPGTADRPSGPSDPSTSVAGELVDPTGPWPWARVSQESWWTRGPSDPGLIHQRHQIDLTGTRTQGRVALDCWCTPRAIGPKRGAPGTADQPRGPSDTGPGCPGQLVDPADPRARA